jgi:hypothetical protein
MSVEMDAAVPTPPPLSGYGLLRWTGSVADLDYLIDSDDNDPLEAA